MATKMIKFDLQMKGVKITSLDELQDNLSADILPIFQTGRLAKWLMSRELVAQSEVIAAIDKNSTELQQLAAICRVLELDDDEDVLQFLLDDRQAAQAAQTTASIPAVAVSDVAAEETFTPLLSEVDWSGLDMSEREFVREDLRNANLKKTNFQKANLSHADLSQADLSGANLTGANLIGANLTGANLTGADLSSARIESSNFRSANLTGAELSLVSSCGYRSFGRVRDNGLLKYKSENNSRSADFSYSNLTKACFIHSELVSDDFTGANLTSATLENSTLDGSNFSDANLTRANLSNATLHNANFTNADLSFANLNGAMFERYDENRQSLGEKVNVTNAKLTGVIGFESSKIEQAISSFSEEVASEIARGVAVKRDKSWF